MNPKSLAQSEKLQSSYMILYNHISKGNTSVTEALALAVNFSNLFGDQVIIPYSEENGRWCGCIIVSNLI